MDGVGQRSPGVENQDLNFVGHVEQDGIMNDDCLQRECLFLGEEEFCLRE
jgi:hypothetical protein